MTFEKWLQSRLTAHGFPVGPIDGIIGGATRSALRAFQRKHGFDMTGEADLQTVTGLRASSTAMTPKETADAPSRVIDVSGTMSEPELTQKPWPRQKDVRQFFGGVGERQTQIEVPFDFYLAWSKGTRVKRITVHELVAASASRALTAIAERYTAAERVALGIDLFGGSLNVRKMRGGNAYSMHSWGIAIDFDPERNQLKWGAPNARLSHADAVDFWKAWEAEGWVSLGRVKNFDWMHVQAARL